MIFFSLLTACSKQHQHAYQSEIEGFVYKTKYCYKSQVQTTRKQFLKTLQLAEQQDPNAEYLTGLTYYYGINTPVDKNLGIKYLLKAAKQNNDKAMLVYGTILLNKTHNIQQATYWLKKSANMGNILAQTSLAIILTSDYSDYQKYQILLKKNVLHDGYAQYVSGFFKVQPEDNPQKSKGIDLLTKAFKNPNSPIYIKIETARLLGLSYPLDNKKQIQYWESQLENTLVKYNCSKKHQIISSIFYI